MAPGTEFARDFCAGIGPLQLGVVLVDFFFKLKVCYTCIFIEKSRVVSAKDFFLE